MSLTKFYAGIFGLKNSAGVFLTLFCTSVHQNSIQVDCLFSCVPVVLIIISDCLCQQWLDRSHKVTNPIKLIIQVLNYTRKHRYPERRSAFTYIDEEQPTCMDYGKEKFGGPFTEEEVEDVKTFFRLFLMIISVNICVGGLKYSPVKVFFKMAVMSWFY